MCNSFNHLTPVCDFNQRGHQLNRIKQAITAHHNIASNFYVFEAKGLTWIKGNVSDSALPKSPRKLILSLESKEFLGKHVFATITKIWKGNFDLIYKKKRYNESSPIEPYLSA